MRWEKRPDAIRIPAVRPLRAVGCESISGRVSRISPRDFGHGCGLTARSFASRLPASQNIYKIVNMSTRIGKMRVSQNGEMNIHISLIDDIDAIAIYSVLFQLWSAKRESSLTQARERRLRIDIADENPRIGESNRIKKNTRDRFLSSVDVYR